MSAERVVSVICADGELRFDAAGEFTIQANEESVTVEFPNGSRLRFLYSVSVELDGPMVDFLCRAPSEVRSRPNGPA